MMIQAGDDDTGQYWQRDDNVRQTRWIFQDKWKLPTPSRIATDSFSRIVDLDEYSGSLR